MPPQGSLWIGREAPLRNDANARALHGDLDDLRIYGDRALDSEEVYALYLSEHCTGGIETPESAEESVRQGTVEAQARSEGESANKSVPNASTNIANGSIFYSRQLLLTWSFHGELKHADVVPADGETSSNLQGQPLNLSGQREFYYFRKGPPHVDAPPRPECYSNGIHGCEVRVHEGAPLVRAVSADRCYFAKGGTTSDFGPWVPVGGISCATNHFFSSEAVACQLKLGVRGAPRVQPYLAPGLKIPEVAFRVPDFGSMSEAHIEWYNRVARDLLRPPGTGESSLT